MTTDPDEHIFNIEPHFDGEATVIDNGEILYSGDDNAVTMSA